MARGMPFPRPEFMRLALRLARRGKGRTSPTPPVGALAMRDPNPLVAGKGFRALRKAGISVESGLMEEEARSLNRPYCRWVVSGKPFVTMKLAVSLDGQIAAASGESRWISGEGARRKVHRMRSEADAVLG